MGYTNWAYGARCTFGSTYKNGLRLKCTVPCSDHRITDLSTVGHMALCIYRDTLPIWVARTAGFPLNFSALKGLKSLQAAQEKVSGIAGLSVKNPSSWRKNSRVLMAEIHGVSQCRNISAGILWSRGERDTSIFNGSSWVSGVELVLWLFRIIVMLCYVLTFTDRVQQLSGVLCHVTAGELLRVDVHVQKYE